MSRDRRRGGRRSARSGQRLPAAPSPALEVAAGHDAAPKRTGPEPRGGGDVHRVTVRLSALEYAGATELARQRSVTVSDVVRDALIERLLGQIGMGRAGVGKTGEPKSPEVTVE